MVNKCKVKQKLFIETMAYQFIKSGALNLCGLNNATIYAEINPYTQPIDLSFM